MRFSYLLATEGLVQIGITCYNEHGDPITQQQLLWLVGKLRQSNRRNEQPRCLGR